MTANPAATLRCEVRQLVDLQIETLKRPSSLTSTQLLEYQERSQRIWMLYGELDRIGRSELQLEFARAS